MLFYTLTKNAYKNHDGILLTYVPKDVMLYFNKGCLQESGWYISYYVPRDKLCYILTKDAYRN